MRIMIEGLTNGLFDGQNTSAIDVAASEASYIRHCRAALEEVYGENVAYDLHADGPNRYYVVGAANDSETEENVQAICEYVYDAGMANNGLHDWLVELAPEAAL